MEVAGIVVGGVGLAISFQTCMETFEYVDSGKKYGKDYQKAALKLSVLELRLSRWSQQVKFEEDTSMTTGNTTTATAEQSEQVKSLLGQIQDDLEAAAKASRRYALPTTIEDEEKKGTATLEYLAARFRRLALERQGRASFVAKTKWALKDKKKLDSLIEDITNGVGSLELVFPATEAHSKQQRQAVIADVENLVGPSEVEEPEDDAEPIASILREATEGVDTQLQKAIDIAVKATASGDSFTLKDIKISNEARADFGDFVASGYTGPSGPKGNRTVDNMNVSGAARVKVGNVYGGEYKSVFSD